MCSTDQHRAPPATNRCGDLLRRPTLEVCYVASRPLRSSDPLFSVVIPTHNRADLLPRAVTSVLQQRFSDFEIVIVDDGSTDAKAVDPTQLPGDARIRYARNPSSLGPAGARNLGIRLARGKYVSFLDDDDEYLDSFLLSTYHTLEGTSDQVAAFWCGVRKVHYQPESESPSHCQLREFPTQFPTTSSLFQSFVMIGTGYGLTVKRSAIDRIGMFDVSFKIIEDTEYFVRFLDAGYHPRLVPGVHVAVHYHHRPKMQSPRNRAGRLAEIDRLTAKYARFIEEHPAVSAVLGGQRQLLAELLSDEGSGTEHFQTRADPRA
jgi:glycosyltransferase involved in cell wall biosynthesis